MWIISRSTNLGITFTDFVSVVCSAVCMTVIMKMTAGDHYHHWWLGLLEIYKPVISVVHRQIAVTRTIIFCLIVKMYVVYV